jgi:alpha-amylase
MSLKYILIFYVYLFKNIISEDCSNFNSENSCQGSATEYPDSWSDRKWQTPPRDNPLWRESYQDMHLIVGYVQILYNNDKTSAQLNIITSLNTEKLPNDHTVTYIFGSTRTTLNTYEVSKEDTSTAIDVRVEVSVSGNIIAQLKLDPVDLIWNNIKINSSANYENGQKGAIIEMFGWLYDDIAKECEFIGKAGYLGVKIFPPQEAIFSFSTVENGELNPWYFIYQPVSYKLHSRNGNRSQLKNMIDTCRKNNVRVYADAVINHMTGSGNDMFPDHRNQAGGSCVHWTNKNSSAGSPWYTHGYQYQNSTFSDKRPGLEYPSVPYNPSHFHCERSLNSWTDPFYLNYGWLVGLADLKTESDYVRQRIADYLTDLLSIGFSGFRIDAAKHISPDNLSAIFKKLKDNLGGGDLPEDFISYLEVIIGGEKDLLMCNENSYNFGTYFEKAMTKSGMSESDISKIKIWESDYPKEFPICGYWSISSERYAIGLDCHDDQFPGSSSRDMGDKGSVLVKEKNVDKHRNFQVFFFKFRWKCLPEAMEIGK